MPDLLNKSDIRTRIIDEDKEPISAFDDVDNPHHKKLLQYLWERWNVASSRMYDWHHSWYEADYLYYDYLNAEFEKSEHGVITGVAKLKHPLILNQVNTVQSQIRERLLSRIPLFEYSAVADEAFQMPDIMSRVVQNNVKEANILEEVDKAMNNAIVYNLGALYCPYIVQFDHVEREVPSIFTGTERTSVLERTFEGTMVKYIEPRKIFFDVGVPIARAAIDGQYIIHKETLSKANFIRQSEYSFINEVVESYLGSSDHTDDDYDFYNTHSNQEYVDLYHYSIKIIPKEFGLSDSQLPETWKFVVAKNERIVLAQRWRSNYKRHPYVVTTPFTYDNKDHPFGLPFQLQSMQSVANSALQSFYANNKRNANNVILYDPARMNAEKVRQATTFGGTIPVSNALGAPMDRFLQSVGFHDNSGRYLNALAIADADADAISGLNQQTRGDPLTKRQTAIEAQINQQNGVNRIDSLIRTIASQIFAPLGDILLQNSLQLMSFEYWVKVVGAQDASIIDPNTPLQRISSSFDAVIGSSRQEEAQIYLTLLPLISNNPAPHVLVMVSHILNRLNIQGGEQLLSQIQQIVQQQLIAPTRTAAAMNDIDTLLKREYKGNEIETHDNIIDEKQWVLFRKLLSIPPIETHAIAVLQGRLIQLDELRKSKEKLDARIRNKHR